MRKVAVFLLVSLGLGLDYLYVVGRLSGAEVFSILAFGATTVLLVVILVRTGIVRGDS